MYPHSLVARLMLAVLMGMLVMAAVAAFALLRSNSSDNAVMAEDLRSAAAHIADGLYLESAGNLVLRLKKHRDDIYATMPHDAAFRVLDADGHELASSEQGALLTNLRGMPLAVREFSMPTTQGEITLWTSVRERELEGRNYTVQVAYSDRLLNTLERYRERLYLRAGLVSALCALAVFWVMVYLTVKRMVRPLRRISAAAARIEPSNLSARLGSDDLPEEIRPLVDAFNAALARLENGYKVQQQFLAAAAHELKTPLALLRAEIELGSASNRELLLRDTDLMARQVHQLLHLAEVSEGQNFRYGMLYPGQVAAEVIDYLSRMAEGQSVQLRLNGEDDVQVQVDPGALFILLKNLLENALNHSPPGSVVTVVLTAAGIDVVDEGSGIAVADRTQLFKRFWRGARAAGQGAGLGLAICREIAMAHGWSIGAEVRTPGTGAVFQLRYRAQ